MNFKMFKLSSAAVFLAQRRLLLSSTCPQISKDTLHTMLRYAKNFYLLALRIHIVGAKIHFQIQLNSDIFGNFFVD